MKNFYDFNQRVHLRRDPAQFGRIGRGPFAELAAKSGKTIRQFVFWEHQDADLVTCENVADLMSEGEYHERRRLFFAAMRHPELRVLRAALYDLKWEHSVEWASLTRIEIDSPNLSNSSDHTPWILVTDHHISICFSPEIVPADFLVFRLHEPADPLCTCDCCQEARKQSA